MHLSHHDMQVFQWYHLERSHHHFLTLFVLSQVFREGAAMREEQKMTI